MNNGQNENPVKLGSIVKLISGKWYWIVIALLLFNAIAFLLNRYSKEVHQVNTTLFVEKEEAVDPLDFLYGESKNIASTKGNPLANEKILLTSFPIMISTLGKLDFNVSYYFGNQFSLTELYKNTPIQLEADNASSELPYDKDFTLYPLNQEEYTLEVDGNRQKYKFDQSYELNGFKFKIVVTQPDALMAYEFIVFRLNSLSKLVNEYRNMVNVFPVTENIIQLSVNHENVSKASDFLNRLSLEAIEYNMRQKRQNFEKIVEFIDNQIVINADSLQILESEIKTFKNNKVVINPETEGNRLYENITSLEEQKANILLSNEYYQYLRDAITKEDLDYSELVVPSSVGIADPILNELVSRLIDMQREVRLLLSERKTKNPLLIEKQAIIVELTKNIVNNIENQKKASELQIRDLDRRLASAQAALKKMPQAQQELTNIKRDYSLNENLYMVLMQKKLDAGIRSAAVGPDYLIVNQAYDEGIISASPLRNYIAAVLLGLIIPVGLILIVDFFDTRIKSKEELMSITQFPVLGTLPLAKNQGEINHINSPLMEAFRQLRANLRYLGPGHKVYLVSSSSSGDGKSFCSQNLAYILSLAQKKVLWIDADLRKYSKKREKATKEVGLSDYLVGLYEQEAITKPSGDKNPYLDIIRSGTLPPNPAELLISKRMSDLLNRLKDQYDHIIIDTPPVNLFADAMELMPLVDHNLLLVRLKHTHESSFKYTLDLLKKQQTRDLSIVINGEVLKENVYQQSKYYTKSKKGKKGKKLVKQ